VLLPKIKKIPKNTNGRLAIPALAGLLVYYLDAVLCKFNDVNFTTYDNKIEIVAL